MQQIGLDAVLNNVPDFTGGIDKMNRAVDSFASNSKQQGEDFDGGFGKIVTGALKHIGELAVDALLKAGQAVTGFVKDSIGLAGDFQSGMQQFSVAAGKDLDTSGLKQFHDLFLQLGKDLPVSTAEVQQAAIEMVKGGIDPAILAAGGLKQNIQFAAAAMGGDLVKAAEISSKIVGGWGEVGATAAEKADLLTHATDQMTKAANASQVDVEGLSRGIFNAQGIAKTAGVSFDDLTTTLAELAPRFSSSSEAGNSLKNMIVRLQPTTDPATEAMRQLGLYTDKTGSAFYDAQGNFVGFQKASQLLQNSLKGLTKEQQASALQTIFGNDAMSSASALAELGSAGYQEMSDSMAKAMGVAEAGAILQDSFNTKLENAAGSMETLKLTIGEQLLPILSSLFDGYITPGINTLTDFASALFGNDAALAKLSPTMQAVVGVIDVLVADVQGIVGAFQDAGAGSSEFGESIGLLASDLGLPGDLIEAIIFEIQKLTQAFTDGGITGAIDQLIADITDALPDIEAALLAWGQAFVDWIAPMIPPVLQALGDMADAAWGWVKEQAPGWGKQLMAWGNELVAWIAPMIPPALAELGKLGQSFLGWIGDQAAPLLKKFNDWATSFVAWIVPATVTFLAEWPKMFDQFLDWIGNEAGPLLKKMGDWAIAFIGWIAPMIPPFLVALGGVALAIGTWVIETAAVLSKKIVEVWVPAILGWIVTDAIPGLVRALDSFLKVFDGWIKDAEASLGRAMIGVGKAVVGGIEQGVKGAWDGFVSWMEGLAKGLPDWFKAWWGINSPAKEFIPIGGAVVEGIMQGFSDMWPSLTDLVSTMSDDLIKQAADIGKNIQNAIADSFGATASIDRQIAANLDKFKDVLPEYQQYTTGALKDAETQARAFLDPTEGARYFKMRSDQILEYAALQKKLSETQNAEDRKRIEQQMGLINAAQTAEVSQSNASPRDNPVQELVDQINQLFNNPKQAELEKQLAEAKTDAERQRIQKLLEAATLPVNDTGIGHDLMLLLNQFMQMATAPHRAGGGPVDMGMPYWVGEQGPELFYPKMAGEIVSQPNMRAPTGGGSSSVYNGQVGNTIHMPIYTNQSPSVLQSSMAIVGAALM